MASSFLDQHLFAITYHHRAVDEHTVAYVSSRSSSAPWLAAEVGVAGSRHGRTGNARNCAGWPGEKGANASCLKSRRRRWFDIAECALGEGVGMKRPTLGLEMSLSFFVRSSCLDISCDDFVYSALLASGWSAGVVVVEDKMDFDSFANMCRCMAEEQLPASNFRT
jgi:hypothetical protein